uniref:Uncharacterized protein n=1 Tax=Bionectria ochroleuca TaxID=29856 RepID=A0A8H7NIG2_BIOOC
MFTSTRPVSVLYLRGEDLDDPDAHPVSLPGNQSPQSKPDGSTWPARSAQSSIAESMVSPSPSSLSLASQQSTAAQGGQWQNFDVIQGGDAPLKVANDKPIQVNKTDDEGKTSGYIEAVGVDPTYCPPPTGHRSPSLASTFFAPITITAYKNNTTERSISCSEIYKNSTAALLRNGIWSQRKFAGPSTPFAMVLISRWTTMLYVPCEKAKT